MTHLAAEAILHCIPCHCTSLGRTTPGRHGVSGSPSLSQKYLDRCTAVLCCVRDKLRYSGEIGPVHSPGRLCHSALHSSERRLLTARRLHATRCLMSYHENSLTWHSNNPNQGKRSLQSQGNHALSLPPSQLSIPPGLTIPPSYSNPYQHSPYSTNPSPFAFPSHSNLTHQHPYVHQHSIPQQQTTHIPQSPSLHNPRKRSVTDLDSASTLSSGYHLEHHGLFSPTDSAKGVHGSGYALAGSSSSAAGPSALDSMPQGGEAEVAPKPKKGRTNTPWTPAEEHRLKVMRDAGNSWSEIAKTFPTRTEGSVKKHWYKVCERLRLLIVS